MGDTITVLAEEAALRSQLKEYEQKRKKHVACVKRWIEQHRDQHNKNVKNYYDRNKEIITNKRREARAKKLEAKKQAKEAAKAEAEAEESAKRSHLLDSETKKMIDELKN